MDFTGGDVGVHHDVIVDTGPPRVAVLIPSDAVGHPRGGRLEFGERLGPWVEPQRPGRRLHHPARRPDVALPVGGQPAAHPDHPLRWGERLNLLRARIDDPEIAVQIGKARLVAEMGSDD